MEQSRPSSNATNGLVCRGPLAMGPRRLSMRGRFDNIFRLSIGAVAKKFSDSFNGGRKISLTHTTTSLTKPLWQTIIQMCMKKTYGTVDLSVQQNLGLCRRQVKVTLSSTLSASSRSPGGATWRRRWKTCYNLLDTSNLNRSNYENRNCNISIHDTDWGSQGDHHGYY